MTERDFGITRHLCPYRLHRLGTPEYVCDRLLVTESREVVCSEEVCPMRPGGEKFRRMEEALRIIHFRASIWHDLQEENWTLREIERKAREALK